MHIKKSLTYLLALILVVVMGLGIGIFAGNTMLSGILSGNTILPLLVYKPSFEYAVVLKKLNSRNELDRLSAYYALLDNNKVDTSFLIDRFKKEKSEYIRRSIIWIMGFSPDKKKTVKEFSLVFEKSSPQIQCEMISSIKRLNHELLEEFMNNKKVFPEKCRNSRILP